MKPPKPPQPLLMIEDTPSLQMVYRAILNSAGFRVNICGNAFEGMALFQEMQPKVVLLDLILPDRDGLDVMKEMMALQPETNVIVVTAHGSVNKAVEAMCAGAHDFLVKPFHDQRLLAAVENAHRIPRSNGRARPVGEATWDRPEDHKMIGSSAPMAGVRAKIRAAASSMATVFITGESGTGKNLCARALHDHSDRASGPFVTLDCAALTTESADSEIFGHVKGAFSGATTNAVGAIEAASGGTLFLDNLLELPPEAQSKLLRFLQSFTVQPLGAATARRVNVRIVCATSRDPAEAVRRGQFREDLFYHLFVVPIQLPPLRDRDGDAAEIAEDAMVRIALQEGRSVNPLSAAMRAELQTMSWHGNVRELLNVAHNLVLMADSGSATLRDVLRGGPPATDAAPPAKLALSDLAGLTLSEIEQRVIRLALSRHAGSVPRAARELDIAPSTLYRKLESWARENQA